MRIARVLLRPAALAGCLPAGDPEVTGGIIEGEYMPAITVLSQQGPMGEEIAIDRYPDGHLYVYEQWCLADCTRRETLVVSAGVVPQGDAGGYGLHAAVAMERARVQAGGRSLAQVQAALRAAGLEAEIDIGGEDPPVVQRNCGSGAG